MNSMRRGEPRAHRAIVQYARDPSETGVDLGRIPQQGAYAARRSSKGGMVEQIEGRRAEVQADALREGEPFLERGIDLVVAGTVRDIAAQITPGRSHSRERRTPPG